MHPVAKEIEALNNRLRRLHTNARESIGETMIESLTFRDIGDPTGEGEYMIGVSAVIAGKEYGIDYVVNPITGEILREVEWSDGNSILKVLDYQMAGILFDSARNFAFLIAK